MSKNVAVFVDVANIFYAAKAGGVDIDYVTLLKSAVAGRDFVRAYAYTGLDPENENQRQFHSFLARNGYKVVSKDIRKYGDGRIKANLDIELVVDLMRLARNLDIAVVVSGDGDFAPAIRAVQEMGVRVEVISFRGNTSSDLIEVADQFTDIAQVARVDKTSARSGRRVAAEGDMSMTAVPEKETEGAPRRRRGRTAAARTAEAVEAEAPGSNLIVLPGERLSHAPEAEAEPTDEPEEAGFGDEASGEAGEAGDRRRRRRRGGRGRGRGRRDELRPDERPAAASAEGEEDEEEFEELPPTQLPHHTFGSVWDSQLGVPSVPLSTAAQAFDANADFDDELDEPEVPEYLLAERRQQRQRGGRDRGRMARGGRQGSYQAAIERERYGRGGSPFGGSRLTERPRQDRPRRAPAGGPRPSRPDRPQHDRRPSPVVIPSSPSGEPWSEVPEELEDLLRAEVARKSSQPAADLPVARRNERSEQPREEPSATAQPARRRTRTARPRAGAATEGSAGAEARPDAGPAPEKPKRTTRTRAGTSATDTAAPAEPAAEQAQPAAKPKRATRSRAKAADAASDTAADGAGGGETAKAVRRRRTKASEPAAEE